MGAIQAFKPSISISNSFSVKFVTNLLDSLATKSFLICINSNQTFLFFKKVDNKEGLILFKAGII